jgi:hypothetical protein
LADLTGKERELEELRSAPPPMVEVSESLTNYAN